jgi:hypothetical protein
MAKRPPNTNQIMENSAPFDLGQALGQWRANLQSLGGFRTEELEELESHLRESISVLHARGLSLQEAFMIAARRLGSERQLSEEYAKANPQRVWTERAMWMVAGVLVAHALSVVVGPLLAVLTNCALGSALDAHLVVGLHFLVSWVAWLGTTAIAYWILCRQSSWRDNVVAAAIRSPVLIGVGLFTVLEYLRYVMSDVGRFAEPVYRFFGERDVAPSPQTIAIINSWFFWGNLLTQLLWIAAGPLLAGYAWRKRQSSASGSASHYELKPGEQEAARALQGQGLSLDESGLVLEQRRCSREAVASALARVPNRAIWLERAVWMVAGVALSRCLGWLVLQPAWIVSVASQPAAPLFQHVAGFASLSSARRSPPPFWRFYGDGSCGTPARVPPSAAFAASGRSWRLLRSSWCTKASGAAVMFCLCM